MIHIKFINVQNISNDEVVKIKFLFFIDNIDFYTGMCFFLVKAGRKAYSVALNSTKNSAKMPNHNSGDVNRVVCDLLTSGYRMCGYLHYYNFSSVNYFLLQLRYFTNYRSERNILKLTSNFRFF